MRRPPATVVNVAHLALTVVLFVVLIVLLVQGQVRQGEAIERRQGNQADQFSILWCLLLEGPDDDPRFTIEQLAGCAQANGAEVRVRLPEERIG